MASSIVLLGQRGWQEAKRKSESRTLATPSDMAMGQGRDPKGEKNVSKRVVPRILLFDHNDVSILFVVPKWRQRA